MPDRTRLMGHRMPTSGNIERESTIQPTGHFVDAV